MDFLKRIPIQYKGELHDVRLINFSVPIAEVLSSVPQGIAVRNFDGRAMISMVDVSLRNMRPAFVPSFLNFNYRHIAFRLLVDDGAYNNGDQKGIFFLRSFTNQKAIVAGGGLLTAYNLELAAICEEHNESTVRIGKNRICYQLGSSIKANQNLELKNTIGTLDRAYSVLGKDICVTQIQREKWPIQEVDCSKFENSFFHDARFEGAFRVFDTIYYKWLPAVPIT